MAAAAKILQMGELVHRAGAWRAQGKRIVHCHGVFDLLHIGHIHHLEEARALGDVLVVTVTADRFVNKGPSRPAFTAPLRAEAVAALHCVDAVAINDAATAIPIIAELRADVYAKGSEYEDAARDVTGGIVAEREAVESVGGRVVFTRSRVFSSSKLLNQYMPALPENAREFLAAFGRRYSVATVAEWLERIRGLRVLVVGETIVDEYQYCESIGKSSKAAALVGKAESLERFAGGIVAVANNVAAFCERVTVVSQLGDRDSHEAFLLERLRSGMEPVFLRRRDSPTIVKRRFVESYFLTSMFELYEVNDAPLGDEETGALVAALEARLPDHDVVLVVDYGHGMLGAPSVDLLCDRSRFLAMNAQANAGNRGYHRLSKYPRADYVCAARSEMELESRTWRGDLRPVIEDVAGRLGCGTVVVTRGDAGSIGYRRGEGFIEVPALAAGVVDRVGAGDAFLAVTAPLVATAAPMDLVGFLGNAAGAEAVATVGHRSYLERDRLLKHVGALLA